MIAFITWNSNLVPLLEGLCTSNPCETASFLDTACSLEDETRNGERNANWNPEWLGDFSQLVKIEKIKFLGISRYKVTGVYLLALQ